MGWGGGGGGGGGHILIERAISYHFSQKGYHVRACTTGIRGHPRRAVPGTVWGRDYIRESVDSLCRDGADAQYMQYLSKSRITSTQIR